MDREACKVSVLCTAYNHEKYIRSALDGFVGQKTNFPFEVLINDDASTDATADIIREYQNKYPDIIVPFYQPKNLYSQHISIMHTVLVPQAHGKYLAYCEGDDFWTDPDKLQLQVDFMDTHPDYSACVHDTLWHNCDRKQEDWLPFGPRKDQDFLFEDVIKGMPYQTSSLLARRELILRNPDFYLRCVANGFGDYPQAIWLSMNGKIRFMGRVMSTYRYQSNASSWSAQTYQDREKLLSHQEAIIELLQAVKSYVSAERAALADQVILQKQFEAAEIKGEYLQMKRPPFEALYAKLSAAHRFKIFVKQHFPGLYRTYQRSK